MRCWECGAVPNVDVSGTDPVHVVCKCGKDLGWLEPKLKGPPLPKPTLPKSTIAPKPKPTLDDCPNPSAEPDDNRRTVDGNGYTGGVCLLLFGLLFMVAGGYYFWQADDAVATMTKTEGTVISAEDRGSGRSRYAEATVQFVANDGNTYDANWKMLAGTRAGQKVPVLYDPDNPLTNREASYNALYGFAWAGTGIGFILFCLGIFSTYKTAADNAKFYDELAEEEAALGSRFPPICACCAKGKPAGTWRIYGKTTTVEGPAATVHSTPFVEVPICARCRWRIYGIFAFAAAVGISVGAIVAAIIFFQFYESEDLKTVGAGAALGGVIIGAIAGAIVEYFTRSHVTLGHLEESGDIRFKNLDYVFLHYVYVTGGDTSAKPPGLESALGKGNG